MVKQAIILAAGESSRFWPLNQKHKSLIKVMGKPLIYWATEGLKKCGIKDIIIVQGPKKDIQKESGIKAKYVIQQKPKGTGDAVWQARKLLKGPFIVADPRKVDIQDYLPLLLKKFKTNPKKAVLLGVKTDRPEDFGMIKFRGRKVAGIVENPLRGKEPSNIKATETYILPADFFDYYKRVSAGEANLIDAINLLIKKNGAEVVLVKTEPVSLKYPWDLFPVLEYLLKNSKTKVYIGKNCKISKNCYLRGPVSIGDNCKIGNSVEIKNSIIGDNARIPHLSYIGDSIIGENCNLGAGTITANLRFDKNNVKAKIKGNLMDTGREKLGCIIGANSQTGIHVSLMPGVLIGSNCAIGPSSVVFDNIEDDSIFYTKFDGIVDKRK